MTEIVINVYHLWVVASITIIAAIFMFLLHNFGGLRLFVRKDECIANKFLDKFDLVSPEFRKQSLCLQNIENNQEIHEINKKLEKIMQIIEELHNNG